MANHNPQNTFHVLLSTLSGQKQELEFLLQLLNKKLCVKQQLLTDMHICSSCFTWNLIVQSGLFWDGNSLMLVTVWETDGLWQCSSPLQSSSLGSKVGKPLIYPLYFAIVSSDAHFYCNFNTLKFVFFYVDVNLHSSFTVCYKAEPLHMQNQS